MWYLKYKFGMSRPRYSLFQANIDPVTAIAIGSAVQGGATLGAAALNKPAGIKKISTFSKRQKQVDKMIFDFLMNVRRGPDGRVISMEPRLEKLRRQGVPERRRAQFTKAQTGLLDIAKGLTPKATNRERPDLGFVQEQRGKILGAALGGNFDEAVVVGDDFLPEIAMPDGKGGITVIPNPDSLANPQRAMANSLAATDAIGLPGKALGDTPFTSQFNFGDGQSAFAAGDFDFQHGLNPFQRGEAAFDPFNQAFGEFARAELSKGADAFKGGGNVSGRGRGNREVNLDKFLLNKFGDDFSAFNFFRKSGGLKQGPKSTRLKGLAQDFFKTLPQATGNPKVDELLSQLSPEEQNKFINFTAANPGLINSRTLGFRGGTLGFQNPFDVDTANLERSIGDFRAANPLADPNAPPPVPGLTGAEASTIFTSQFDEFDLTDITSITELSGELDDFYKTDAGKLLKSAGVDISVGLSGLEVSDNLTESQLQQFNSAFDAFEEAGGAADPEAESTAGLDTAKTLTDIATGLASAEFDPSATLDEFNVGVGDPARGIFEGRTTDEINQQFGGSNLFSGQRGKFIEQQRQSMEKDLIAQQARFQTTARRDFNSRKDNAIALAADLTKLPGDLMQQKANVELTKAAVVNTFANIEMQQAMVNSDLTNAELAGTMLLWNLLGSEQMEQDANFQTDFMNAITGEDGFSISSLLNILSQYNSQGQTAVVTG